MKIYLKRIGDRILLSLMQDIQKSFIGSVKAGNPGLDGVNVLDSSTISQKINPKEFVDNPNFINILNGVLSKSITNSPAHQSLAAHLKNGYLNIQDLRAPEHWGRVADPEDILGSVLVQNQKMVPNTFEPMPTHRLFTRQGIFKLDPYLLENLLKELG
jgi:hypothetical protein